MKPTEKTHATAVDTGAQANASPYLAGRGYASGLASNIMNAATFVSGVFYVILQYSRTKAIADAIFVSILIAATMILLIGIRKVHEFLVTRGLEFYTFVLSTENPSEVYSRHLRLCRSVTNFPRMTAIGIAYGMALASAPFLLNVWRANVPIRFAMAIFMFTVNFVTGVAFYGLLTFFWQAIKMGSEARVNLWQAKNPSTDFLIGATRRIAVIASIYVSMCISSIIFSIFPLGGLVISYSAFACFIIIASLVVPPLPVARKIRAEKRTALVQLDQELQRAFFAVLKEPSEESADHLERFQALLQLRESIEAIPTWPFKVKSLTTGASVIFFSSVPVVLHILLQRLAK